MALFLSTYQNKIDKKGRVSVPAPFRAVLCKEEHDNNAIVVYKSFINDCIEACSVERIEKLYGMIDELDPFSPERDALTTVILGNSMQLTFDPEGRVLLPLDLIEFIDVSDQVCFVGKGSTFEMWNPVKFDEYMKKSQEVAKKNRELLSSRNLSRSVK